MSAACPGSATGRAAASAICSIPASSTPAAARRSTSSTTPAIAGLQHRVRQLRAERRRGLAAERQGRLPADDPRRSRAGDGARQLRHLVQQRRPRASTPASTTPIPATRSRPTARRRARSSRWCRPGETWPVLLRSPERLGPSPGIPGVPVYPMAINFNSGVNLFHPNSRTPYLAVVLGRPAAARSAGRWRSKSATSARGSSDGTATEDWNEVNWTTNGFLDEFKLAQANLQAQHGRGPRQLRSRARSVPGTGTSPLPIYLAKFNGQPAGERRQPGALHGHQLDEQRRGSTSSPRATRTRRAPRTRCSRRGVPRRTWRAAGYPRNFFVLNPDVGNASRS